MPAGTIPLVPLTGIREKEPPLHIVAVKALTDGVGLTVTVTLNVAPVQLPDEGVTV